MTTSPLRVVFLDHDTVAPQTVLRPFEFEYRLTRYGSTRAGQVAERIADADIVISNKVAIRHADIQQASRLKLIAVAATGVDNIDLQACTERNIVVCNIRDYARTTVPEHTFALIFALRRSLVAYRESIRDGRWQDAGQFCYFDFPIKDLAGSVLGIVGRGSLGHATAAIGQALGMKVMYAGRKGVNNPPHPYTAFSEMLAHSDIISLHCPLNEDTRDLISDEEFEAMKRKPLLINTARGGLVNEPALARALRAGLIGGAGIDVTAPEPPPKDHILMQLLDMPNFIMTPHVGWASDEAMQTLADQLVDNIDAFVRGEPRNVVAPVSSP